VNVSIEKSPISTEVKSAINLLIKDGWENYRKYEMHTARDFADQILKIAKANSYPRGIMIAYYLYGLINASLNRFDLALDDYFEGLKAVLNKTDDDSESMAYENIGRCYGQLEDYEKSIEYFHKSLSLNESLSVRDNLGQCYLRMNQIDLADKYLSEAYSKLKKDKDIAIHKLFLFSDICLNLSQVHLKKKQPEEALKVLMEVLKLDVIEKDMKIKSSLYSAMGLTYSHLKQYREADEFHQKSIEIAIQYDTKEVLYESYRNYAEHFEMQGKFEDAFHQNEKYLETRNELFSTEITNKVLALSAHFDKELKDLEITQKEIEHGKNEIENKLKQLQAIYASVSGIGKVGIFSEKMKSIMKMVDFFHLDRSVPVLIEGETGTGKEIIARMIHFNRSEDDGPFVILNCSAISATLFESELFGYEEGAFTGANQKGRMGKFELAQDGTLFLDEIGDLPIELQPKLLRALQQKEIYRVGGNKRIPLNVRIIAATNRDLRQEIKTGNFRSDLYYRLNTGHIFIPNLQERDEEIIPLAQMFLIDFSKEKRKHFQYIETAAAKILQTFSWPGNVRELRNAIERIVLLNDDVCLKKEHLNFITGIEQQESGFDKIQFDFRDKELQLSSIEEQIVSNVLKMHQGSISNTAKYLKTSRNRIYNNQH
jgi:two-component system, NtrC family, response regulator AtoC